MPRPWAAPCAVAEPGAAPGAQPPVGTIRVGSMALEGAVPEEAAGRKALAWEEAPLAPLPPYLITRRKVAAATDGLGVRGS